MSRLFIFDPQPPAHEYLSVMFFNPMRQYAQRNGIVIDGPNDIDSMRDGTVLLLSDYLNKETISRLKNNNCKIVGFSVTDSSYVSQPCREAAELSQVDLLFMLTGLQTVNKGYEFKIDSNFQISLEERRFLPEADWEVFDARRKAGKIRSLPYVHWERQPDMPPKPYGERSQKVLIRGGGHMRRVILAYLLMRLDRLDVNSGFVLRPYADPNMNPQFRYCTPCQQEFAAHGSQFLYSRVDGRGDCNSPAIWGSNLDLSDMGQWNNRCPKSFYWLAQEFQKAHGSIDMGQVQTMMNAHWMNQRDHLEILSRILYTSDLKWLFSIYAAQRFWDAAMVGTINLLPKRTNQQAYFPEMFDGIHYMTFQDDFSELAADTMMTPEHYRFVSANASALYDQWMRPTEYSISTNLLSHIFTTIENETP